MSETQSEAPTDASDVMLQGRLHPSVIALWTLQAFAPLVALWIASSAQQALALVAITLTIIGAWIRWTRFRWRVEPEQLIIEHGLLQRTRRVIPIERIQAVQTVRKIRHRVFGVVGLRIETVGGNQTEGQLDALPLATATTVQRLLLRETEAGQPPTGPPSGSVLARCSPRMLLVAGLTGGRVGVAAALLAFVQEIAGRRVADAVLSAPERLGLTMIIIVVLLGIAAAFAISVLATAVTYWDFTVMRDGDLIRLHRGVLDERRDTVPLTRVQALTVEENPIRRALGLAAVKMVVAGRAGEDEALTSTLLPIASRDEAFALAGAVLGIDVPDRSALRAMPQAARARRLTRAAVAVIAVTAVTLIALDWPSGLWGLVSAAAVVPVALAAYHALGWHRDANVVLARAGWLVRRTSITPVHAPQSLRVVSSPFQRRRRLATLRIEIARTARARDPRLIDLRQRDADDLQVTLADETTARLQRASRAT